MGNKRQQKTRTKRDTNRIDLAAELELDESTIMRHIRRGAPHSKRANRLWFNVAEYRAWMAANGLTGERGKPSDHHDSPDLERARLRKENALASKYELQVQRERGELIPMADVRQWIAEHVQAAKSKLIGMGAALAPVLEGRDAAERQDIIEHRTREILEELAEASDRLGGQPGVATAA
jgi:hypothetical protein